MRTRFASVPDERWPAAPNAADLDARRQRSRAVASGFCRHRKLVPRDVSTFAHVACVRNGDSILRRFQWRTSGFAQDNLSTAERPTLSELLLRISHNFEAAAG